MSDVQMHVTPLSGSARQHAIDNAGIVHKDVARIMSWTMVALAICTAFMRSAIRFKTRHKLFLDDYLVLVAVVMMVAAASIYNTVLDGLYLYRASTKPNSRVVFDASELDILLPVTSYSFAFVETSWTAIFCIEFSFLSLFYTLIRNLSVGLTRYYWGVVVFNILTWAYMLSEAPMLCHYFGAEAIKCINEDGIKWTILIALVAFLDILTDFLVISFPILILRKSLMDKRQKIWIRFFLSTSAFMIILAFIRILGGISPGEKGLDATWQLLWVLLEACVAVIAASATAMRSAFIRKDAPEYIAPDPPQRIRYFPKGFSLLNYTVTEERDESPPEPRIPLSVVKKPGVTAMSGMSQWRACSVASSGDRLC